MSAVSVRVLFFASLRDVVGTGREAVTLPAGSYADLKMQLHERLGSAAEALWEDNVRVALNQTLLDTSGDDFASSIVFSEGDEIAFLPPVTGG